MDRKPIIPEIALGEIKGLTFDTIVRTLEPRLTDRRKERIETVLDHRTYSVTTVFEKIFDFGNLHAVMRTSEALGFQALNIIQATHTTRTANRATQGAHEWLDILRWQNTYDCMSHLKQCGYRIVTTALSDSARDVSEIDFASPVALVFGNEKRGVSNELLGFADETVKIPMVGFSQSFNISVATAICLHQAYQYRVSHLNRSGDLTPNEREYLRALYYFRSVKRADLILAQRPESISTSDSV